MLHEALGGMHPQRLVNEQLQVGANQVALVEVVGALLGQNLLEDARGVGGLRFRQVKKRGAAYLEQRRLLQAFRAVVLAHIAHARVAVLNMLEFGRRALSTITQYLHSARDHSREVLPQS